MRLFQACLTLFFLFLVPASSRIECWSEHGYTKPRPANCRETIKRIKADHRSFLLFRGHAITYAYGDCHVEIQSQENRWPLSDLPLPEIRWDNIRLATRDVIDACFQPGNRTNFGFVSTIGFKTTEGLRGRASMKVFGNEISNESPSTKKRPNPTDLKESGLKKPQRSDTKLSEQNAANRPGDVDLNL